MSPINSSVSSVLSVPLLSHRPLTERRFRVSTKFPLFLGNLQLWLDL